MVNIKKAVILAGGLATRMRPASKVIPKEMFPIVDIPAMQYLVNDLIDSGINQILIISSKDKISIQNYFKNDKAIFTYIYPNEPLGVADALLHAKYFVKNEPFLLLFGDILFFSKVSSVKQMINQFKKTNNLIVATKRMEKSKLHLYGCVKYNELNKIKYLVDIKEKPSKNEAPSNMVLIGQYILKPTIFNYLQKLKKQELFTDCLVKCSKKNPIQIVSILGHCFDIGSKAGFVKACIYQGLQNEETQKEVLNYIKNLKIKLN